MTESLAKNMGPFFRYGLVILLSLASLVLFVWIMQTGNAQVDNTAVATSVQRDLYRGVASLPPERSRNQVTGIDTWTDCVAIGVATYGPNRVEYRIANAEFINARPGQHKCDRIAEKANRQFAEGEAVSNYWRYWWGSATLFNIVTGLVKLDIATYRERLKLSTYGCIVLLTLLTFARFGRNAWAFLPLGFTLVFGFEIPLFGQSIAHAPGLIAGLVLVTAYLALKLDRRRDFYQLAFFFFSGGVVFYFELLNGNLIAVLLCLALVVLISAHHAAAGDYDPQRRANRWRNAVTMLSVLGAYSAGAVSMAIMRIVARSVKTQQTITEVASEWARQVDKFGTDKLLIDGSDGYQNLLRLYYDLDAATYPYLGRYELLGIYAVCAVVYLTVFAYLMVPERRRDPRIRDTMVALALIVLIVPIWYLVFLKHAVVHPWMMMRLWALFFALAPCAAILLRQLSHPGQSPAIGKRAAAG